MGNLSSVPSTTVGFEAYQSESYQSMYNAVEKCIKNKDKIIETQYIRAVILETFKNNGGKKFWFVSSKLLVNLQTKCLMAWKFCFLLHKLLRDGHALMIKDSLPYREQIINIGLLWSHTGCQGYRDISNCILSYSQLIVLKLNFHEKHYMIPGNLQMGVNSVEKLGDNNFHFEFLGDVFGYLDQILALWDTMRPFTYDTDGKDDNLRKLFRLSWIPLMQEAIELYDFGVRIMILLHRELAADLLMNYRDRFRQISRLLEIFYSFMLVDAEILKTPLAKSPNFSFKNGFKNYTKPVLEILNESPEIESNNHFFSPSSNLVNPTPSAPPLLLIDFDGDNNDETENIYEEIKPVTPKPPIAPKPTFNKNPPIPPRSFEKLPRQNSCANESIYRNVQMPQRRTQSMHQVKNNLEVANLKLTLTELKSELYQSQANIRELESKIATLMNDKS